ncbi:MAG: cobalamin biosynthesis protein CobD [Oligoflexia bacterium]|nr:cobalamin biosynthesis protein CobD [Oligoflexia bacterium]
MLITIAFILDLILGDPRRLPHPVNAIAALASKVEYFFRHHLLGSTKSSGALAALTVYITTLATILLTKKFASHFIHPLLGTLISIYILYTTFALKSLLQHIMAVYRELKGSELVLARQKLSLIVGRDTKNLSRQEIIRATVETAAENLVDGVTAPLFYAFLGGAELALLYKAVNTLDSLWGHKDERYFHFGFFAAKTDDLFNYLPARLTAPLIALSALAVGGNFFTTLTILRRDGRKHASPNAGLAEAAWAGALRVQLGGINYYDGEIHHAPLLGDNTTTLNDDHIKKSVTMIITTALLFLLLFQIVQLLPGVLHDHLSY